ncbi:SPARC-related modular calcium-binding protein 2 [Sinocyclocheilus grahami]|uniref:SPARC-related modular calcium-binding protein 2 n=1 Tax=Sinocyclocheilus grahami TaxID=75366 RepID=UPI0007AC968C|nr:PREDICTED: SPARC-related modular calcium-binding protein 2-like [Sinocyclocheilus grahami]
MRVSVLLLLCALYAGDAHKLSALTFLHVEQDKECNMDCSGAPRKPLCASDGRTFSSRCEFLRAKCRDPQLEVIRGSCKDTSRCVAEKKYTEQQAKKLFPQVFVPVCNPDGTYSEVQCHSYTGYCWCVTPSGRPISGSAVANKKPQCQGSKKDKVNPKEPGKSDPPTFFAVETQPSADEEDIISQYPTLWTEQVRSRQNRTRTQSTSCDQEQLSAQEEARQHKNEAVFVPECAHGGLYKPVQCHPSTGYCWCVLVDTGRPIPGTSTRRRYFLELDSSWSLSPFIYFTPFLCLTLPQRPRVIRSSCQHRKKHDNIKTKQFLCQNVLTVASTNPFSAIPPPGTAGVSWWTLDDPYLEHPQGCPGEKKTEFLTSVLDALSTDMVHAVTDPASAGRMLEPDPSHTLEERVVHWYFSQLDKNSSGDIGKKEIKPFKRLLRKKSKPKKCVKKFVEYCDISNDKALSLQELMGCLGVTKEEGAKTGEGTTASKLNLSKKQG